MKVQLGCLFNAHICAVCAGAGGRLQSSLENIHIMFLLSVSLADKALCPGMRSCDSLLGITLHVLSNEHVRAVDVLENRLHEFFSFHSIDRRSPLSGHIKKGDELAAVTLGSLGSIDVCTEDGLENVLHGVSSFRSIGRCSPLPGHIVIRQCAETGWQIFSL